MTQKGKDMTDDSIEAKALALVNEVQADWNYQLGSLVFKRDRDIFSEALCRAIEQHEATKQELSDFRQRVGDAVKDACKFAKDNPDRWAEYLAIRFSFIIIPKPKPDPLVEVIEVLRQLPDDTSSADIIIALEARGLEIREKGQ